MENDTMQPMFGEMLNEETFGEPLTPLPPKRHGLVERIKDSIKEAEGLGDIIADATSSIGIKPCDGCKKRKKVLNKWVPFHKRNQ